MRGNKHSKQTFKVSVLGTGYIQNQHVNITLKLSDIKDIKLTANKWFQVKEIS